MDLLISNNGYEHSLLVLSGWGFDHNIFRQLDLPFNTILPIGHLAAPFNMEKLQDSLPETFFVMGWSMGATIAVDLAQQYAKRIQGMFLCCLRSDFSEDEIGRQKDLMQEIGMKGYLARFYKRCFSGQMEDFSWFRDEVETVCLEAASLERLISGLDYLQQHPIKTLTHLQVPIKLFYGNRDLICPSEKVPESLPRLHEKYIFKCGHLPFLKPDFLNLLRFDQ